MRGLNVFLFFVISLGVCCAECPHGWLHFSDSCYLFSDDSLSWYDASSMCRAHHGYLTTIETHEENAFLKHEAMVRKSKFWLGATDDIIEGEWIWSNSEKPFSFTDWTPNQPDNAGNEDCLELWQEQHYKWNDRPCAYHNRFICERSYPDVGEVVGR